MSSATTSTASTTPTANVPSSTSKKDLLQIVPAYYAPARVWADKVLLLTSDICPTSAALVDVVKSRLPDALFTQVATANFPSIKDLLDRVVRLEQGPSSVAAQQFFGEKLTLPAGQKVSAVYHSLLPVAAQLFPGVATDVVETVARMKFLSSLPPSTQAMVALAAKSTPFEEVLTTLDGVAHMEVSAAKIASVEAATPPTEHGVLQRLEERLEALELNVVRQAGNSSRFHQMYPRDQQGKHSNQQQLCFFHAKFGAKARNCRPPCSWQREAKNY